MFTFLCYFTLPFSTTLFLFFFEKFQIRFLHIRRIDRNVWLVVRASVIQILNCRSINLNFDWMEWKRFRIWMSEGCFEKVHGYFSISFFRGWKLQSNFLFKYSREVGVFNQEISWKIFEIRKWKMLFSFLYFCDEMFFEIFMVIFTLDLLKCFGQVWEINEEFFACLDGILEWVVGFLNWGFCHDFLTTFWNFYKENLSSFSWVSRIKKWHLLKQFFFWNHHLL